MQTKNLFLLCLTLLLLLSTACKSKIDPPELVYPDQILAGQTTGDGIYYSGPINDTLFFEYPSSSTDLPIDLNNDGTNDFELQFVGSASPGHSSSSNSIVPSTNCFVAIPAPGDSLADTLATNTIINSDLSWTNADCILYNHYWDASGSTSETGYWNNISGKHLGLKVITEDYTLYGWMRIEITYGWNLTLIDYAHTVGY